ncbi:hypothetical protein EV126DRAFT_407214 [Verticillium dahliae]|nr:hypothetical protein EV126DRAFT_437011 [Verticillium dahliae]KAH6710358.1 hypothetical protein EV126DRAFT_407214 [Verticillium dahliae]
MAMVAWWAATASGAAAWRWCWCWCWWVRQGSHCQGSSCLDPQGPPSEAPSITARSPCCKRSSLYGARGRRHEECMTSGR